MIKKKFPFIIVIVSLLLLTIIYFEKKSPAEIWPWKGRDAKTYGRVTSRYGPVENARVRIAGQEEYTLTDRQGRFELATGHLSGTGFLVTAGKDGWFNNGQVGNRAGGMGEIFLNPVYLDDKPEYRFISPVTCSRCHVKVTRYWDKSKMAHTTSNPMVLDMFYGTDAFKRQGVGPGYRLDNPNSDGNCVTCHAPSAAVSGFRSQDLNSALRSPLTEWDGISCDYCHKVRKVVPNNSKPSGMSAVLERQSSANGSSILVFGPYDDVVVPPMAASYNPVYEQAEFCSTCHGHFKPLEGDNTWDPKNIYSPLEWEGFGLKDKKVLPIQTTYHEWKQWQDQLPSNDPNKGKRCQQCHMSWRKEMLPYDNYIVDDMARHMWGKYRSPQNIHPHHFDGGTETQLKTALAMELEGEIGDGRKRLHVRVYLTNTNGGHWVPTGETMRSVMLLLQVTDATGRPLKMIKGERLPEWTGKGNREQGNYAGLPGTVFARVLQDDAGEIHVPFWRATRIAQDNRIRPKGTVLLEFEFALDDPDDEPTVEAKLIYRPVIRPLAEKKNWSVKDILITAKVW
ncbi:MAG: multiheme c-type cytochrome [Pseudomonadota bacterium]